MQARLVPADFYTIGYERLSFDELFSLLKGAGVRCLIDVRIRPWSQVPDYRKETLEEKLGEYEDVQGYAIKYISMPSLGNPYKDAGWKEEYRHMISVKNDELDMLRRNILKCPSVLMCYEKDPADCHRSILAEIIKKRYGLDHMDIREKR